MGALAGGVTAVAYQTVATAVAPAAKALTQVRATTLAVSRIGHLQFISVLRSVCRSEGRKDAPVPAAAPEEQEDGEVQMAAPVAQAAPGMPVHSSIN